MNAAIYISDPSILGSKLFDQIKEIKSYKDMSKNGLATGLVLTLDFGEATFNFMQPEELENHLKGFASYAMQTIENKEGRARVLSKIHNVKYVLGGSFIVSPGAEEKMEKFIFDFKDKLNGLLFMRDGIFE